MSDLPRGWGRIRLGDHVYLAGRIGWRGLKADEYAESGPLLLSTYNLNYGNEVDYRDANHITRARYEESPEIMVREDDILLTKDGAGIGKLGIVKGLAQEATVNSSLLLIRARESIIPKYLFFFFAGPKLQGLAKERITGSTTPHLFQRDIKEFDVAVPPLNEQRRIVAKLEALQARSRRARAALDAVPPLLEKLRQSILAAAFRGDLTKDWRAKHKDAEPASELLKRIRTERRKKWEEAELAKMKAKGKSPTDDKWKAKYREPEPVDTTGLPELPERWCWASVEELATKVVDGVHKKPNYLPSGIPFLTVKNLTAGPGISFDDLNYVSRQDHEEFIKRTDPELGDILISKDGTLGVTRLIRTDSTFSIFVSLALVKPVLRNMGEYLESAFLSPVFQERFKATGSGLLHIHLVDLRAAALPLAPMQEQALVTARAQDALRLLDVQVRHHSELVGGLATLERAVLAKAFRGELVPQDPNDEPADVMLTRTRQTPSTLVAGEAKRGRRMKVSGAPGVQVDD